MKRTNIERQDRTTDAGAHGDGTAGNEGIDEPALDQTNRTEESSEEAAPDSMVGTDRSAGDKMKRSSQQQAEQGTDNDRQQGREETDDNGASFTGQGGQKEASAGKAREGTGYTKKS